jgi:hypothetical protein
MRFAYACHLNVSHCNSFRFMFDPPMRTIECSSDIGDEIIIDREMSAADLWLRIVLKGGV